MPTGAKDVKSSWASGNLVFAEKTAGNGAQVHFGVDASGLDVKFFGATTGVSMLWDESADKLIMTKGGVSFSGAFTDDVIDFTDVTINFTGSNGPAYIRAGTYASPVANADEDQSGMMRLYWQTSADGSSYDRGIFVCLKTTGLKGIFPIAGLAEVLAQGGAGPNKAQAAQFIAMLQTSTSKLATRGGDATAGMFGVWAKVGSVTGSVASAGSRVAAVWVDNQMNGTVSGEEYGIFASTGGSVPDAFVGFDTSSGGWAQLFYFNAAATAKPPYVSTGCSVTVATVPYLKVLIDTVQYGIPLIAI